MSARPILPLLVLLPLATAAQAASYPIRHLEPNDALLALRARIPELSEDCRAVPHRANEPSSARIRGAIEITCQTPAVQARIQAAIDAIDAAPPTHRFHVVVLQASRKPGPDPDLSPAELKALSDFKQVMTYKSFQLEGETLLQADREAQAQVNPDLDLELVVEWGSVNVETINVRKFQLRASNPVFLNDGKTPHRPTFLETSFSIKKGETIVLGSSTSDQQARVILVTAMP